MSYIQQQILCVLIAPNLFSHCAAFKCFEIPQPSNTNVAKENTQKPFLKASLFFIMYDMNFNTAAR